MRGFLGRKRAWQEFFSVLAKEHAGVKEVGGGHNFARLWRFRIGAKCSTQQSDAPSNSFYRIRCRWGKDSRSSYNGHHHQAFLTAMNRVFCRPLGGICVDPADTVLINLVLLELISSCCQPYHLLFCLRTHKGVFLVEFSRDHRRNDACKSSKLV